MSDAAFFVLIFVVDVVQCWGKVFRHRRENGYFQVMFWLTCLLNIHYVFGGAAYFFIISVGYIFAIRRNSHKNFI